MRVQKYGLAMMVTTDDGLKSYLTQVLSQLSGASTFPSPLPPDLNVNSLARERGSSKVGVSCEWCRVGRRARALGFQR